MLARSSPLLEQRADGDVDALDAKLRIDNAAIDLPPQRDTVGEAKCAVRADRTKALERNINVVI